MATKGIQLRLVDQAVLATLDRIEHLAAKPGAIMSAIAAYLVTATQRHFERETGPNGKWQKLSPRTAAKRSGRGTRGYGHMLRVTNRLYSSITGEATDTEAAVGTNLLYAAIQQLGGEANIPAREQDLHFGKTNRGRRFVKASRKRKETVRVSIGAHSISIPARPYLYVDQADQAEILQIAEDAFRAEADAHSGARP
ncbi:phage virion morphogenesis protein [Mesorhizobium qingshengii]|uniref:Phage virion morphogenesis (Putative tail completion) protein n=1 Tax=Mesorhizobium qingshengii TaxID=1165689 RepID=A0A1G5UZU9_9HYPH|nr:phage virion morphogenesis protein [Mesorhizobium qingshengii]SDA39153.1 phage virion morphogenesis (putative tail completion) protein [Mesorhizobium qingshengii]